MNDQTKKRVAQLLGEKLQNPVTIVLLTGPDPHAQEYVEAAREIASTLVESSNGLLSVQEIDISKDAAGAQKYGVTDMVPTIALLDANGQDQNFRFHGAPLGYEFSILLDDLIDVSAQATRLTAEGREAVKAIGEEAQIYVFSTPG